MSFLLDVMGPRRDAQGEVVWTQGWVGAGGTLDAMEMGGESRRTGAGETVTQERALGLSAYWASLRNLSQDVAKLPRQLRKRRAVRGSDLVREHPAARLATRQPNPVMNGFQFVQLLQFRALGWGNGYAEIVRARAGGPPLELWPVHPSRIKPVLGGREGKTLTYEWRMKPGDAPITMPARDILHVRGLGSGVEGYSLLRIGAEILGLGLAAQKNAARFFAEGMAKRLVAFVKNVLGSEGRKALRKRILEDEEGDPTGRRRLPIVEGDVTLHESGINPEDAQLLESREFTVEEIARIVRMALAKIQYFKRAQGWNSLDALNTDYVTDSLLPWVLTWEEELGSKLLSEDEWGSDSHFFKFVLQGLMRGDSAARTKYYESGIRNAWLSPNDVRELEDFNPIEKPEADEYRMQAQMVPIDEEPAPPAPPPFGAPPTPPEPEPTKGEPDEKKPKEEARVVGPGQRAALVALTEDVAQGRRSLLEAAGAVRGLVGLTAEEALDLLEPAAVHWATVARQPAAPPAPPSITVHLPKDAVRVEAPAVHVDVHVPKQVAVEFVRDHQGRIVGTKPGGKDA